MRAWFPSAYRLDRAPRSRTLKMKMDNLKNKLSFVILGRSGSGKGTQAEFLMKHFGAGGFRLETGRFLRALNERYDNPTTALSRDVLKKGHFVPSWLALFAWLNEFIEGGHGGKHLVFDGSPRMEWEARVIDEVMTWHGRPLPIGIVIEVSAKEAARRLLGRGRADDNPIAIRGRLAAFTRYVVPVIKHYEKRRRLIRINGEQSVESVWRDLGSALKKKIGKQWRLP